MSGHRTLFLARKDVTDMARACRCELVVVDWLKVVCVDAQCRRTREKKGKRRRTYPAPCPSSPTRMPGPRMPGGKVRVATECIWANIEKIAVRSGGLVLFLRTLRTDAERVEVRCTCLNKTEKLEAREREREGESTDSMQNRHN